MPVEILNSGLVVQMFKRYCEMFKRYWETRCRENQIERDQAIDQYQIDHQNNVDLILASMYVVSTASCSLFQN